MAAEPHSNFSMGALEERVTGLERGVAHISESVEALARDVRDRAKFPWPAIWGGVSVLLVIITMFGGVVIWGANAYLGTITATLTAQQAQLISIDSTIVPRGELEGHWVNTAAEDAALQRQIDQMRADFGSSFSLNDTLKALMERVDRLEQIRLNQSVK